MNPGAHATPTPASTRHRLITGAVLLLHLGLVLLFCPPSVVFSEQPYGAQDYQTHFQQTHTLDQVIRGHGRAWAYDPNMLAGFPVGLFFDVDNKAHSLFAIGLSRLGLPLAMAFNLFTLVSCLLAPLSLLLAARLLQMDHHGRLTALVLGVLLWHFDSGLRFAWSAGMISFGTASHGFVVPLALFYRLVLERRWRFFVALVPALTLMLLVHVWTFVILVVPMVGLYLRYARRLGLLGHAQVWGVATLALAGNAYWLWPALNQLELMAPSARLGQANPLFLLSDYLGLVIDPLTTGFILQHTFFRYLALFASLFTLWAWRRGGGPRYFYGSLTLGWLLFLTYCAAFVPGLEHTEPYRFVAPTTILVGLLAAPWLSRVLGSLRARELPAAARGLLLLLVLLAASRGLREVAYFVPELVPGYGPSAAATVDPATPSANTANAGGGPFRLFGLRADYRSLANYLRRDCTEEGRILVQEWPVGEYLRWALDRPIIGGFPDRRTIHEAANVMRRPFDPRLRGAALAHYLVRYNVRYVVVSGLYVPALEARRELLEPRKRLGLYRVYRVRHFGNYFQRGKGKLRAGLNRIEVRDAQPHPGTQELVLRFHHLRTLRCAPGCRVERAPVDGDTAGFIRVVGAPRLARRLVISNGY